IPWPRSWRRKAMLLGGEDLAALVGALLGGLGLLVPLALALVLGLARVVGAGAGAVSLALVDAGTLHHAGGLLGGLARAHRDAGADADAAVGELHRAALELLLAAVGARLAADGEGGLAAELPGDFRGDLVELRLDDALLRVHLLVGGPLLEVLRLGGLVVHHD